jgi:hypothetical protein
VVIVRLGRSSRFEIGVAPRTGRVHTIFSLKEIQACMRAGSAYALAFHQRRRHPDERLYPTWVQPCGDRTKLLSVDSMSSIV